ncbi:MAG: MscL family protein, partial [Lachnospiraceae bacterium]|nr:MscL family protein [Lachnospiraceae bacterium]
LGLFGGTDFSTLFILLSKTDQTFTSVAEAREAGAAVFAYGSFITAVINFLITALVIFILVKAVNKAMSIGKKPEAPKAPTTKKCPFCKSEIAIDATRCPHCTSILEENK